MVDHEESGFLYDPDREDEGIDAIRELLAHDGKRRFYARMARKRATESSWPAETKRLLQAYRKAITMHRTAGALGRLRRVLFA